ncbi:MAG: hypothetical protein WC437_04930 [Patescibacteria group bacterium]
MAQTTKLPSRPSSDGGMFVNPFFQMLHLWWEDLHDLKANLRKIEAQLEEENYRRKNNLP